MKNIIKFLLSILVLVIHSWVFSDNFYRIDKRFDSNWKHKWSNKFGIGVGIINYNDFTKTLSFTFKRDYPLELVSWNKQFLASNPKDTYEFTLSDSQTCITLYLILYRFLFEFSFSNQIMSQSSVWSYTWERNGETYYATDTATLSRTFLLIGIYDYIQMKQTKILFAYGGGLAFLHYSATLNYNYFVEEKEWNWSFWPSVEEYRLYLYTTSTKESTLYISPYISLGIRIPIVLSNRVSISFDPEIKLVLFDGFSYRISASVVALFFGY